ncbi:hypothetical protein KEM52_000309 [Ascosphaera acerosa]|nr:hypothetical protein KEM52_000309 [Ascosphaera acerosa]
MHISTLYPLLVILPATVHGLHVKAVAPDSAPAVVGIDFEKHRTSRNPNKKAKRKDKVYVEDLTNERVLYNAAISLGTPAQKLEAQVDTGSSDLWVNSPQSAICRSRGKPCEQTGTFDSKKSSSYEKVNSDFNITYVDGSGAAGDYGTDTFTYGSIKLDKFQFGIGLQSSSENNVLGIGYPTNEVYVATTGNKPYANLPQALVDQKLINSRAYSIFLNDYDAEKGQILFGGIDTEKFEGELQTVPLVKPRGGVYQEFALDLTAVSLTQDGKERKIMSGALPVVLDTGSTFNNLPSKFVAALNGRLDGFYDQRLGIDVVPCAARSSADYMTFAFSGATVRVPLTEMILEPSYLGMGTITDVNGNKLCILGVSPLDSDSGISILGDTFLRSAYTVYDLDNNEISLANAKMGASKSNIMEIGKGEQAVPSASDVENPVTSGDVGGGDIHGPFGPTATGDQTVNAALAGPTPRPEHVAAGLAGLAGAGFFAAML